MNNADVMEKIYLEYREKVFRYVRGKVRNLADAEDVTSEIFLKVQTTLDSYNEEKPPFPLGSIPSPTIQYVIITVNGVKERSPSMRTLSALTQTMAWWLKLKTRF